MTDPAASSKAFTWSVPPEKRPRHVAIIMDGNGRWAQRQGLPRIEGHRRGVQSVRNVTEESARLGLAQLTLFCLSSENWKRPQQELDFLMRLLEQYVIEERSTIMDQDIRLVTIGRRDGIPDSVVEELDKTIDMSRENAGMRLCLAINYGARTEMLDAARRLAHDVQTGSLAVEAIGEDDFADRLYTAGMPDPDLLIRTAGEMRISNYLLWQISYAELWFTERCWPEFEIDELHEALRDYIARERRFGGLS